MLRPTLLILATLGLVLLLKGLRGRRVGSALHCRCGYCLEGLPELKACPECAAAIWDPINTHRGSIKRSPRLAWTGGVLLTLGASAWLSLRLAAPPGTNPYSWQPTPLLTLQSPDNGINGQWFAREINDRLEAGTLSPSQQSALAARARTRLNAQLWQHDAPGYRSASAWAAIYVALWRSGAVTDEQLLDMLSCSFLCRAFAGQHTSPGGANQQATVHHLVQFAVRGPFRAITLTGPTRTGVTLNGEFAPLSFGPVLANATGELDGGQGHNLTLDLALFTQSEAAEIQVCFPLDQAPFIGAPPPPPPPHAFWVITLHVPPIDPATGLPSGDVTLHHSLADEDPVAAAQTRMHQRQEKEFFERLRREHEARQPPAQPTPPPPPP